MRVPLALKDLYDAEGLPTTASSRVLDGAAPAERDSEMWARLRGAGMVLIGHTHTHESAAGGTTDQVGNPWDVSRSAGGSSGGSGAALAAGMVPAALGSDTCGSLRIPAAVCGVASIKPTHGRLPLTGVLPLAWTLDHPGPMARRVADCAALFNAMADGPPDTIPVSPPPASIGALATVGAAAATGRWPAAVALTDRIDRCRSRTTCWGGWTPCAPRRGAGRGDRRAAQTAGRPVRTSTRSCSATCSPTTSPTSRRATATAPRSASCSSWGNPGVPVEVYVGAQMRRAELTAAWEAWFVEHRIDAILEPCVPMTAQPRGDGYDPGHLGGDGDPWIVLSSTWDATGFPVVALPSGLGSAAGCPWMSIVAPRGGEATVVEIGLELEAVLPGGSGLGRRPGQPALERLAGDLLVGLDVALPGARDDVLRDLGRGRLLVPARRGGPVAHVLLVEPRLAPPTGSRRPARSASCRA